MSQVNLRCMMSEKDCFNAISGRKIKAIGYEAGNYDNVLNIETHDGFKFRISSKGGEMSIKQVEG